MARKAIIFVLTGFLVCGLLHTSRKTAQGYDSYDAGFSDPGLLENNKPDPTSSVRRHKENENTITVKADFGHPEFSKTTINGIQYDRVMIDGLENIGNPGEPVLPVKSLKVFIPIDKSVVSTRIVYGGKIRLSGQYQIEPGQEEVPLSNADAAEITQPDQSIYSSNEAFPKRVYKCISRQELYKSEIAIFNLYPVEYVPQNGQVSYYKSLTIIVNLGPKPEGALATLSDLNTAYGYFQPLQYAAYETRLRGFVDNPDTVSVPSLPSFNNNSSKKRNYRRLSAQGRYEYIIITDKGFINAFQPLIDSKKRKNLTARIETTQSIYEKYDGLRPDGRIDNQTKIREFIKDAHEQWGTQYVLLGGDIEIIPHRMLYDTTWEHLFPLACHIASDLYYACLDGTFDYNKNGIYGEIGDGEKGGEEGEEVDLLAEVYIGRAPVSEIEEVENFVKKTLLHEKANEELGPMDWKNLMVGEYLGFHYSHEKRDIINVYAKPFMEEIRRGSNACGYYTKGIEESTIQTPFLLYDKDNKWEKQTLIDFMNNETIHFYNHMGHSFVNENMRLTNHDIEDLTNITPFFVYSQGCFVASFDNVDEEGNPTPYDSIAEHFVNADCGAFAYIGNTRSGWYDHFSTNGSSQRFHRHFWDCILAKGIKQLGKANQISKEQNIGLVKERQNRWCYFQITLLGDPELSIGGFKPFDQIERNCTFSISPKEKSFEYTWGSGSIVVTTNMGCSWTAASDSSWIQITSEKSRTGTGTIDYEVLANPESSDRTGQIIIKDKNDQVKASFSVNQKPYPGPPCIIYKLSSLSMNFDHLAGEASFKVITNTKCPWTAASDSSWIQITSEKSGTGTRTIYYKITENTAYSARTGQITIKGENDQVQATFTINQQKAEIIPETLTIVGSYDTPDKAYDIHVQGSYAYVVDEGLGLHIIDITNPQNPTKAGSCYIPDWVEGVYVQNSDYAYVAGRDSGLQAIDITNPQNPKKVGICNTPDWAWDIHIQGAYAYMANGDSGLQVIDITNPKNPKKVGSCNTPGYARGVYVQGTYGYMADYNSGFQVFDISNPANPRIIGSCNTPGHALSVHVQGTYAYVASGELGLHVLDITTPETPAIVSSCDTPGPAYSLNIQGTYAYVASGESGLHVLDITTPETPAIVSSCDTPGSTYSVYVQGTYAYVVDGESGLQVIEITNP